MYLLGLTPLNTSEIQEEHFPTISIKPMLPQRVLRRGNERIEEECEGEGIGPSGESKGKDEREDLAVGTHFKRIHDGRMNSFSRGWATLPLSLGRKIGVLRVEKYR